MQKTVPSGFLLVANSLIYIEINFIADLARCLLLS